MEPAPPSAAAARVAAPHGPRPGGRDRDGVFLGGLRGQRLDGDGPPAVVLVPPVPVAGALGGTGGGVKACWVRWRAGGGMLGCSVVRGGVEAEGAVGDVWGRSGKRDAAGGDINARYMRRWSTSTHHRQPQGGRADADRTNTAYKWLAHRRRDGFSIFALPTAKQLPYRLRDKKTEKAKELHKLTHGWTRPLDGRAEVGVADADVAGLRILRVPRARRLCAGFA